MATAPLAELMDEIVATLEDAIGPTGSIPTADQIVRGINLHPTGLSIDVFQGNPFREDTAAGFADTNGGLVFTVRARVDIADFDGGQDALLLLMDDEADTSLAHALFDDQTLNGYASSVKVEGPTGLTPYTDSPGVTFGVEWGVTVLRATS